MNKIDTDQIDNPDNEPLSFGKYKGLTPMEVYKDLEDYSYLVWLWDNVKPCPISEELYRLAEWEAE